MRGTEDRIGGCLAEFKASLIRWWLGMLLVQTAVIVALVKLLP